ncbi:MAG: hypothetical protein ACJ749_19370, partial [Flavisolibacter sp.]
MAKQKKPGKKKAAQKKATQKKAGPKGNIRSKSTSKKASPKKTKKAVSTKPAVEVKKGALKIEKEGGPRKWFFPLMETAYTKLEPRGESETVRERGRTRGLTPATVTANNVQPESKAVLTPPSQDHWVNVLAEYQQRKVETVSAKAITRGGATRGP